MKKIFKWISLVIALLLLSSKTGLCSEYLGEFTIRSGAKFGMSVKEIDAVEATNGTKVRNIDAERSRLTLKEDYIAGVAVGRCSQDNVMYYFDENNRFVELEYWLGYYDSASTYNRNFESIVSALSKKYQLPLHKNDGNVFSTDGRAWGFFARIYTLSDYAQWLLQYESGYVLCDVVGIRDNNYTYQISMDYKYMTNDEVNAILQTFVDDDNERQSSIDKDI